MSVSNRNYTGMNAAGAPRHSIPDWLDHTANAKENAAVVDSSAPCQDAGPNQAGAVNNQTTIAGPATN